MYDYLLTSTDNMITSYVFGAWAHFNMVLNPWINTMMALYVVITGYLVWLGRANLSFSDLGPRIFKLAVIYALVTNVSLLISFIYNSFIEIPASVINALYAGTSGSTDNINSGMTRIFDMGIQASKAISRDAGYNIILHLYAAWISLLTSCVTIVAAGYIILGKIATAVLLALAPFFIVLYLFAGTKSLFEGWLRQILTFALVPVLTYALLLLIVNFLEQISNEFVAAIEAGSYNIADIAAYTVISGISLLMLSQVMSWAAGIAGGFQLSSLGMIRNSMGGTIKAARGAGSLNNGRKTRLESKAYKPIN